MSLRDLHLKVAYDSDTDDPLREFYVPCLAESYRYDRLAGFFSSSALTVAAKGIASFISNEGTMRLVAGPRLSKEDVEAIHTGGEDLKQAIERRLGGELDRLADEFARDHVQALAWMVHHGYLDVRIAVLLDDAGRPLSVDQIHDNGYFHMKIGLLYDRDGDSLSFSGSCNETASGWHNNIEEFKVFRAWEPTEDKYYKIDQERFLKFWSPTEKKRTLVLPFPEALRQRLIELAPPSFDRLRLEKWVAQAREGLYSPTQVRLRDYQEDAVASWIAQSGRGIFEMATGTGKTLAALECMRRVIAENPKLIVVVAAPTIHLAEQWAGSIAGFGLRTQAIVANSSNPLWKQELSHEILDTATGVRDRLCIITTHATLSSDVFESRLTAFEGKSMLIVDEVHGAGAPKHATGLHDWYDFRLGLSATPSRWLDDEGTSLVLEFFGGVVYSFGLDRAISSVDPSTGRTYLCPYNYYPILVEMTADEFEKYERLSRELVKAFHSVSSERDRRNLLTLLALKRQSVVTNAENKYEELKRLVKRLKPLKHTLVYCSPQQLPNAQSILNAESVIQHKFTYREDTVPSPEYGGKSQREFILDNFERGDYDALVAINCLDEGVDIPPTRTAIFMASSGNPRQFIQRRGRILRRHPGKEFAVVYDMLVTPGPVSSVAVDFLQMERALIAKELKRYEEFAALALNSSEADTTIAELRRKYML